MKRVLLAICLSFMAVWSVGIFAGNVGVVNMQTIFRTSPQIKKINLALQKKFATRKANIMKIGKNLQSEVKKFQKNQTVMNTKSANALRTKITTQGAKLRQLQGRFQKDLMTAQNVEMKKFMVTVKAAVKKIAAQKKLDIVLPSNAVLYSKNNLDITSNVLSDIK